jgi:hypothetical protein
MLTELKGIVGVLENADPKDRARVYTELGMVLRYDPRMKTLHASADLACVVNVRVGGAVPTLSTPETTSSQPWRMEYAA